MPSAQPTAAVDRASTHQAMIASTPSRKFGNAPPGTLLEKYGQTPASAPRRMRPRGRLAKNYPVSDRTGVVIGLSAVEQPEPQTACDRADMFLAHISKDERWAGRYVLARVLRDLYEDFARDMEPLSWRAVAMELRKLIGLDVTYKNIHEGGRNRRLQAYLVPDLRGYYREELNQAKDAVTG